MALRIRADHDLMGYAGARRLYYVIMAMQLTRLLTRNGQGHRSAGYGLAFVHASTYVIDYHMLPSTHHPIHVLRDLSQSAL